MDLLLLHIAASSLLALLVVARFLVIILTHRSNAALRLPIALLTSTAAISGIGLILTAGASITHLCVSVVVSLVLVIIIEVWLRAAYLQRYSGSS